MAFVELVSLSRCRENGGTFIEHDGRELAVFRLEDPQRVVVIDNACPHAAGNLSGGELDGAILTCRSHQWSFDLTTGVCIHSQKVHVRRYRAKVRDGVVWVDYGV